VALARALDAPLALPPGAGATVADRLPDAVRSQYGQGGVSLFGNLLGAVVLAATFAPVAPAAIVVAWCALFSLLWLLRLLTLLRWRRLGDEQAAQEAPLWRRRWTGGALCSGAAWGLAACLFYGFGGSFHRITLLLIVYSYCIGAIPSMAPQYRCFLLFISLCFVPTIVRVATQGDPDALPLAGVLLLIYGMSALLGRGYRHSFNQAIELKMRTERLAAQLQLEKAAAEEARRTAEAANRAKTQFFSAASHDLRQPLHAMGLFAEALRAKSRGDEEVTHLVNSINSSVDALEGLFGELLDITKIDTGGVEARPEHFTLRELFQRLRLQYEPTAFEKGLALRFHGERQAVYADPLLVDRIVRNLLSNAIRYTVDGGVLVSARRRGDAVRVQVWDTGIGITAAEQARVFDEFYQVHGGPPLEANQSKGLGLGLAIVQRLARLMDAPLALDSVPGRGTVFTLTLPAGRAPRARPPESARGKPRLGLTLEGRRILVVEDEPAVREGLCVLLRGWGAQVDAFDSLAAVEGAAPAASPAPALVIVDYRLPEGRTGLEALALLRERFGAPLPAILVTGSTMTGHEEEASRHDFHLLIKPVAPNKLRAMIAFKLGLQ
jgi:signal transduction histidine kinase/CheY-like chemotaxis protein